MHSIKRGKDGWPGTDVVNKMVFAYSGVNILWFVKNSHVTRNIKSECSILT